MKLISIREHPERMTEAIQYFQSKWANENSKMVYEDSIKHCFGSQSVLPQWYLLYDGEIIIGCAGLITNDFISRMDLYPWLCALYIEESHRNHNYASLLIERAKVDAKLAGFKYLYLCSDHVNYYERHGFEYLAIGYHPWGETSGIYQVTLE